MIEGNDIDQRLHISYEMTTAGASYGELYNNFA